MSAESFGAVASSAVVLELLLGAGGEMSVWKPVLGAGSKMSSASCGLYAPRALLNAVSECGSVFDTGCSRYWDPGSFCVSAAAAFSFLLLLALIIDMRSVGSVSFSAMAEGISLWYFARVRNWRGPEMAACHTQRLLVRQCLPATPVFAS
jgi:hypothetical protein